VKLVQFYGGPLDGLESPEGLIPFSFGKVTAKSGTEFTVVDSRGVEHRYASIKGRWGYVYPEAKPTKPRKDRKLP